MFDVVFFLHSTVRHKQDDMTATVSEAVAGFVSEQPHNSGLDQDTHDSFRAKHTHITLTEHERSPRKTINTNQRKYRGIKKDKVNAVLSWRVGFRGGSRV